LPKSYAAETVLRGSQRKCVSPWHLCHSRGTEILAQTAPGRPRRAPAAEVLPSEVKTLAQQTANATSEISARIHDIQHAVKEKVETITSMSANVGGCNQWPDRRRMSARVNSRSGGGILVGVDCSQVPGSKGVCCLLVWTW
jgi:hypothetical protein